MFCSSPEHNFNFKPVGVKSS